MAASTSSQSAAKRITCASTGTKPNPRSDSQFADGALPEAAMTRSKCSLLLLTVLCVSLLDGDACAVPLPAQWLDRLIDQLGDAQPAVRMAAARSLRDKGDAVLPVLRQTAISHANPLVRQGAQALVSAIERGEMQVIGVPAGYWLNRVAFTHDGKRAIATGGAVIVYDLAAGREVRRELELNFARCGFALSRDGKHYVTGHQHDRLVRIGEVETGKPVR